MYSIQKTWFTCNGMILDNIACYKCETLGYPLFGEIIEFSGLCCNFNNERNYIIDDEELETID